MLDEQRYRKQSLLKEIGEDGQRTLAASRAVVVGCGALGTVIANSLVRAGVGHVRIIDRDFIELDNLIGAVDYLNAVGMSAIHKYEKELCEYALSRY